MTFAERITSPFRSIPSLGLPFFRAPDALSELTVPSINPAAATDLPEQSVLPIQKSDLSHPHKLDQITQTKLRGRFDLFERFSDETYLPGTNGRSAVCVAGFSASSYPVREIGHVLNKRLGASVLLSPLALHGSYDEFRHTSFDAWVARIDEQSTRFEKPIGVFYSAASLAAMEVERLNPGRFSGIVCIGTPLALCSQKYQLAMSFATTLRSMAHLTWRQMEHRINEITFDIPGTYIDAPKLVRRNSVYEDTSVKAFLELYRGQRTALRALSQIDCPILYIQGNQDQLVSRKVPGIFERIYPKSLLTVHRVEGGHGPQLEDKRHKVFSLIANWIEKELPH